MPVATGDFKRVDDNETTVKSFVATQLAVYAPFAAMILCPPAAIPVAAMSIGVLVGTFRKPYSSK
jgi:hypothetical protein